MAKFKLFIKQDEILTPFADFNSNVKQNNNRYSFDSEKAESFYNYSENEELTLHKNGRAELKFSMNKFIMINDSFTFNPFVNHLKSGTIIRLEDQYGDIRDFWLSSINYEFSKINLKYNFTCQDFFSYSNSRRNNGYKIENNPESLDFIGAKSIDFWAQKIVKECNIPYTYLPISPDENTWWLISDELFDKMKLIWWDEKNEEKRKVYNRIITFETSNSNGYNALVSLTEQAGLILEVNDNERCIYFKPAKNEEFSGLYYSPNVDLKTFTLSEATDTLVSILNVEGRKIGKDDFVSLMPDYGEKQQSLLLTIKEYNNGENDNYYLGYYREMFLKQLDNKYDYDTLQINNALDRIPWLENKIIKFDYFLDQHLISEEDYKHLWNLIYNDLRKINKNFVYYNSLYFSSLQKQIETFASINNNIDEYYAYINANILDKYKENGYSLEKLTFNIDATLEKFKILWKTTDIKKDLINMNELINKIGKELVDYQKDFLKNIYNFQVLLKDLIKEGKITYDNKTYTIKNTVDSASRKILVTDLTTYWNAAYQNSWYCEYFLPSSCFDSEDFNDNINFNNEALEFMPEVERDLSQDYYLYEYTNETNSNNLNETNIFISKYAIKDSNWQWKQRKINLTENNKQESFSIKSGGYTWDKLKIEKLELDDFNKGSELTSQTKVVDTTTAFGGINCMLLINLLKYYKEESAGLKNKVQKYKTLHDKKWKEIYNRYGDYILEQSYQDKTANTSEELYNNAMNYFKDISSPERQYNLSIINIAALKGYKGDKLQISDQIRIAAEEFYGEHDDLKEAIRQPLFITDISYSLRSDEEIKLTVNAVKYQDKVIQRLVSLIK